MKIRPRFLALLIVAFYCLKCHSQVKKDLLHSSDGVLIKDFSSHFTKCGVEGSIAIFDIKNGKWILSDTTLNMKESLPASTFKIANLLIALETHVIKDENEIIVWPGNPDTLKYGYRPEIYRNLTVKEAYELSAGWVFIELAKRIGRDTYQKYLTQCQYGNGNLSQPDVDFWNFGDFGITPLNQVDFLYRLYKENLPFSKNTMEIVKKVMITEKARDYAIRAKTGWTRDKGVNVGWWVGYIENRQGIYLFATRLIHEGSVNKTSFPKCRKDITKAIFRDLKILK